MVEYSAKELDCLQAIDVIRQALDDLSGKIPEVNVGIDLNSKAQRITASMHERVRTSTLASVTYQDVISRLFPSRPAQ